MRRLVAAALPLALALGACSRPSHPWDAAAFSWDGRLPAGEWIRVRNRDGRVEVLASADGAVHVRAEKSTSGRRAEAVRFLVDSAGTGVTVCAVWGKSGGECSDSEYRSSTEPLWKRILFRHKHVDVRFTVEVPPGVRTDVQTMNGPVKVAGASGDVRATSVNGPVDASTRSGTVVAKTVNGPIRARVDSLSSGGDIELKTVNGSVTAELPASIGATVSLSTVNGRIDSDLPITLQGGLSKHRMEGTIGDGAHHVQISTVNGSVTLRKS